MINDVVIAGAGPNGLMLACELSLAGIRPVVLERLPEPTGEPRANGLVGQVVNVLDRRGLTERLGGPAVLRPAPRFVFAAMPLDLSLIEDNPLYLLSVSQPRLTAVLAERAVELGVRIEYGCELTGLTQDADAVTVELVDGDGGHQIEARYLVGADGGHSPTRKLCGIEFPGVTEDTMVSRTAAATPPHDWIDPRTGVLDVPGYGPIPPFSHHRNDRGLFVWAPFPGRDPVVSTAEWPGVTQPDQPPMSLADLRDSLARVLGVDVPLEPPTGPGPHQLRRVVGGNTRLADRYREGRVLLLGDAAHVHSAIGGPGLNLGLQDAVNLGWKLAAQVHGHAPTGLLASYEAERRPVALRVVMHTQAQSTLIGPGSGVTALRELLGELLEQPGVVQHLADLMSGADTCYAGNGSPGHPLIGRWCPDLQLETPEGECRLADLTVPARPLLIDGTENAAATSATIPWQDRVDPITVRVADRADPTAILLRPDGYVAWASGRQLPDEADLDALRTAARTWFGEPLRPDEIRAVLPR